MLIEIQKVNQGCVCLTQLFCNLHLQFKLKVLLLTILKKNSLNANSSKKLKLYIKVGQTGFQIYYFFQVNYYSLYEYAPQSIHLNV